MSSNQAMAISECILPRDARVPSDMGALAAIAVLGFCPVASAERRARTKSIRGLIATALATPAAA